MPSAVGDEVDQKFDVCVVCSERTEMPEMCQNEREVGEYKSRRKKRVTGVSECMELRESHPRQAANGGHLLVILRLPPDPCHR